MYSKQLAEAARLVVNEKTLIPVSMVEDNSIFTLMKAVYAPEVWDASFRDTIESLLKKAIEEMTAEEVHTYLTYIMCMDRTNEGCLDFHIENGVIAQLCNRYLELEKEKR